MIWKIPLAIQLKQNYFFLLLGYVLFVLLYIDSLHEYLLVYSCCFEVCPNCSEFSKDFFHRTKGSPFPFLWAFFLHCLANEILCGGGLLVPLFWWMVHWRGKQSQVGSQYLKGYDLRPILNHCFLRWVNFQLEDCCCFGAIFFLRKEIEDLYGF